MKTIPPAKWKWFGKAGHLCVSAWCRFHLATKVGKYLVSTVGEYVPPHAHQGTEMSEAEWMKKNYPGEDVGLGRKYETMVFKTKGRCNNLECGCGLPFIHGPEIDFLPANIASIAQANHMQLCLKYSKLN